MRTLRRAILLFGCSSVLIVAALTAPRVLPAALGLSRPDILFAVQTKEKRLFITIDDAPSAHTQEILAVLKRHEVPATFFVIASYVRDSTQLTQIVRDGHTLGNHLRTTRSCAKLPLAEFKSDLDACSEILRRETVPHFFRPASDFGSREQIAAAKAQGYQAVMGTVFPLDHWITGRLLLQRLVRWLVVPGGILIMHDGNRRGETTAAVLDELIPKLKANGYSFGRLDEARSSTADPVRTKKSSVSP